MADDYQCPGEAYGISREIHLGRLARFDPACRTCPHRHETGSLDKRSIKRLERAAEFVPPAPRFTSEGISGLFRQAITPEFVSLLARAFGAEIRRQPGTSLEPVVVLASDGRPLVAELVERVAHGLAWAGCRPLDLGLSTSAGLVRAIAKQNAAGGVLIGNASGAADDIGVKLWGPLGLPLPPSALAALAASLERGLDRPTRRAGRPVYAAPDMSHLSELEEYFHALRPLVWVLDTRSKALEHQLVRLHRDVGCRLLLARELPPPPATTSPSLRSSRAPQPPETARRLAQQVTAARAAFGLWIDGDGEAGTLIDAAGRMVPGEELLLLVARYLLSIEPGAAVIVERETSPSVRSRLEAWGGVCHESSAERSEMAAAMLATRAVLGSGPSGRCWFAGALPCPDAARLLALLLTILSQHDWTLAEALASTLEPAGASR